MVAICQCCGQPRDASMFTRQQLELISVMSTEYQTSSELVYRLYGMSEPEAANETVRAQIMRIRRIDDSLIETRPSRSGGGYRLRP